MFQFTAENLEQWRPQARDMISRGVLPTQVVWDDALQSSLFGEAVLPTPIGLSFTVSPEFMQLAKTVGCHRDARRWDLLYQLLWRLTHGEKHLLRISTDPLMHALRMMEKAVRRDAHKMKAFVRFRLAKNEDGADHYIAWHRPDHHIVRFTAPFFGRRFAVMKWTILTQDESAHWDGEELHFGPGVPESAAPQEDAMEDLWRDYYRAIFNPARIKIKAMKREMPVRHWQTLPETQIIADMLAEAPQRVDKMIAYTQGSTVSAANFMPGNLDLTQLREASKACQGCELHQTATQTVFGVGPTDAKLMLVGEQPGDEEDKQGQPFVGPSGHLLDEALASSGLARENIYITNAVKHFRFLYQESFRNHRSPSRFHVHACKPWLNAEIAAVKPRAILCLGNTAARSLLNPNFMMKENRGKWIGDSPAILATYHPSALLRARGAQQDELKRHFAEDISKAAAFIREAA